MKTTFRVLLLSTAALAASNGFAAQRTFVSAQTGSDTNPCTAVAPCRSFGVALTAADAGGEIVALDSGGYGAVTITKAITITAPTGVYAGITTTTASATGVTSGLPSGVVTLRGLTINGLGVGGIGVQAIGGAEMHFENVVESGYNSGFLLGGTASYYMDHAIVKNNNFSGVIVTGSDINNPVHATITGSSFLSNVNGVVASGYSKVVARHSESNGNSIGFHSGDSAGLSEIDMVDCEASFNSSYGVYANNTGLSLITVESSLITENGTGVGRAGLSAVLSAGDNILNYNVTADGSFNGSAPKQ